MQCGSLDPVPDFILDTMAPDDDDLFPVSYDREFFRSLSGIGVKISNLIAEAIYGEVVGPAIDCHLLRFVVATGAVCGLVLSDTARVEQEVLQCFDLALMKDLNEVPATVAQLLHRRKHFDLVTALQAVAEEFAFRDELAAFLSHYPLQDSEKD